MRVLLGKLEDFQDVDQPFVPQAKDTDEEIAIVL